MLHEISLLEREHLIFLAAIVAIAAAAFAWMVTAISVQCRRWRQSRQALAFKREMIARGLSVADIERLLAAAPPSYLSRVMSTLVHGGVRLVRSFGSLLRMILVACQWGSVRRHEQRLQFKARMIERGLSVADIERLLAAQTPSWPARLAAVIQEGLTQACLACRYFAQSLRNLRRSDACST